MKQYFMTKPQCFIYSFAQVLEIMPDDMLETLGSGLDIWWPEYSGHDRYRGHHPQELVDYCLKLGYAVLQIQVNPMIRDKDIMSPFDKATRLCEYLKQYSGVLTSDTHAVSWSKEEQLCYDPRGMRLAFGDIGRVNWFFPVIKLCC